MPFQLEWNIEGEKQLSRRLRIVTDGIDNLKEPFEKSAKDLKKEFSDDVFETRGGAIDERWRPLSPATVARKARSGGGSQPLVDTGKMQNSFRHRSHRDHAVIWNDTDYFKYHQSNKPRRKLPRRVMMKLAERQRQVVVKHLHSYIQSKIKGR